MIKKVFYNSSTEFIDGGLILTDDQDEQSIFVKVEQEILNCFEENNISLEDIKGPETCILINSKNVMMPYNFSFIQLLHKTNYRGMGSSKLFRCTPTNALASYLSIRFQVQGPALTFTENKQNKNELEEYIEMLYQNGKIKHAILIDVNVVYQINNIEEVAQILLRYHINNSRYRIEIGIEYY